MSTFYWFDPTPNILSAFSHPQYQPQPIVSIVDSSAKTTTADSSLLLDASQSWSPNTQQWPLDHHWQCNNLTDGKECSLVGSDLAVQNNGQLTIGAGKLQENGRCQKWGAGKG